MALTSTVLSTHQEARRKACGIRTGTRTAGNFSIDLGFTPTHIRVCNLTDRIEGFQVVAAALDGGSNAKGLKIIADGTKTYEATGITLDDDLRGFTVVVATIGLETDNDDVYWEAWS